MQYTDHLKILSPLPWKDYELIDTGGFCKLERFGKYILSRPEPQAVWDPSLTSAEWEGMAHAVYTRKKGISSGLLDDDRGDWRIKPGMPEQWTMEYGAIQPALKFRLGLTAFKHIGIFPEQASNWDFIYRSVRESAVEHPQVLNLFAYTGGASLAASVAGAKVTHVDSVKQVINWAAENAGLTGQNNIRWIIDDAMKFVQREFRRGSMYQGIILDPPAYGRGPKGEKWILGENLLEMVKNCINILDKEKGFFLLNLYSVGFSAVIAATLLRSVYREIPEMETGELIIKDLYGKSLPLGIFSRFRTGQKPN